MQFQKKYQSFFQTVFFPATIGPPRLAFAARRAGCLTSLPWPDQRRSDQCVKGSAQMTKTPTDGKSEIGKALKALTWLRNWADRLTDWQPPEPGYRRGAIYYRLEDAQEGTDWLPPPQQRKAGRLLDYLIIWGQSPIKRCKLVTVPRKVQKNRAASH